MEAYEINQFTIRHCVCVCRNASLAETGCAIEVNEEHSGLLAPPTLIFRQHREELGNVSPPPIARLQN